MLRLLVNTFLSEYHRMVFATIGSKRFCRKFPDFAFRALLHFRAKILPPKQWRSLLFACNAYPSILSGHWLFGASASLDDLELYGDREGVLARAEKAWQGIFEVNSRVVNINLSPCNGRWDIDPVSGHQWPHDSVFAPLKGVNGDIRFPWELGRLHQLVWFGQAWRYTKDLKWPEVGISQLEQILSEAPFEHGIHWRDGLQISVRIYSLVAFADLCHDANAGIHYSINRAIEAHAYALSRQLSPHSEITNNHIIGEACALALAGIYLQRDDYLRRGLSRLHLELLRQLYPDGVPYEGSVPYIRFDLDFLSLLVCALNATENGTPKWLKDSIELMAKALASLVDVGGRIPPIGDGDDARVLRLDNEAYLTVNESLHVAGKIIGVPLAPAVSIDSFAFWVVGPNLMTARPLNQLHHFPYAGLIHVNRGSLDVWLDCGPTGYGLYGPGGHGHNDTTAIVIHHNGQALLHDPGWYTYYGDFNMRNYLRSTGAHNTVCIENQEQARLGGLFEIRDDCKPSITRVREIGTAIAVSCGHSGYDRLNLGITYSRIIVIEGKGPWRVRVTDRIRSMVPVKVKSHLGTDFLWVRLSETQWTLLGQHYLHFRSDCGEINIVDAPCSRKTGSLENGSALEWEIPPRHMSSNSEISYISRWEMQVCTPD